MDDASIGRDIIAAGESLSIRDCTVGGAIRLAARTIDIAQTTVDGSITVAGQHVVLNADSTANCFYAIGETVALRGSTKSAALAGDTVTIDGTVEGNVEVWADKLILGKNARITGTVNAHVSEDPERAAGAEVGALKIDRTENEDTSTVNDVIGGTVAAALSTVISKAFSPLFTPFTRSGQTPPPVFPIIPFTLKNGVNSSRISAKHPALSRTVLSELVSSENFVLLLPQTTAIPLNVGSIDTSSANAISALP